MSGIDHPDVTPLMRRLQAFYGEVYGDGDVTPVVPADFRAPSGLFLVGYEDGVPVATGAWRAVDADPADPARRDGDAELKRMYVEPAARGRGHARTVLVALERAAAAAGRRRMILETGDPQSAAIALYESSGYRRTSRFGVYRNDPRSRCFAKPLPG
ncbi:GCN5-related N-acetyltransferase [Pseudonocardia sp. Ae406_Ps2]|nr:GCN5-related N-acetyltransferase [Pseudonocardia sp. Ae406_Ps2]OLM05982.1 GCN5-related N-acetyltransferase [Pseudonocardia sp. Ae331_Ps2]OLM15367.1 GCN5-related N-acetyltransferase [Pseudonocardia sp. Ae505_Ps2]OLM23807.1 GCN5-related N-acetyltransferase [Pseudonocardia sp. Ae706_Ps2]OLM30229.1 GCN5-related N-acetyltransferase [Pseudonocardia sp. Ae717_Ps2]